MVVNYEPPIGYAPHKKFIHRIGRASRYDTLGVSITLYETMNEKDHIESICRLNVSELNNIMNLDEANYLTNEPQPSNAKQNVF